MGLEFPKTHSDWQFDLVGLLAIIGESIIDEIVQPLTASRTVLLPRLLPAPHALIRPSRRAALPSTPVGVVGVYSGTRLQSVPYFPSMIHQLDLVQPYEFHEMTITLTGLGLGEAKCSYVVGPKSYRILIYVGTLLLMVGIVVMSNCSWTMQVTLGVSYLVLNVIYMFCALTPEVSRLWHWDLRLIRIERNQGIQPGNYTETLWWAIQATKSIEWVKIMNAAPRTQAWDTWLEKAKENCENPNWDAVGEKNRMMVMAARNREHAELEELKQGEQDETNISTVRRRPTLL